MPRRPALDLSSWPALALAGQVVHRELIEGRHVAVVDANAPAIALSSLEVFLPS